LATEIHIAFINIFLPSLSAFSPKKGFQTSISLLTYLYSVVRLGPKQFLAATSMKILQQSQKQKQLTLPIFPYYGIPEDE
jgi:cyanate permease